MFCSLTSVLYVPGLISFSYNAKAQGLCFSRPGEATSRSRSLSVDRSSKISSSVPLHEQKRVCVSRAMRWWEKTLKPNNMTEIHSAEKLAHFLVNAGDALVVVDFYSHGCGGCKTLHPKIKKFKDALTKHGNERCNLGPARGLDEKELKDLVSVGEISANSQLLYPKLDKLEDISLRNHDDHSNVWNMENSSYKEHARVVCI